VLILADQDGVQNLYGRGFDTWWKTLYPFAPHVPSETHNAFYLEEAYPPEWHDLICDLQARRGFFRNLPVAPGAVEALHWMLDAGHDVRICTAPLTAYEHCLPEKAAWVEEHLGRDWVKRMIITKDKTIVMGDVLLDDRPDVTGAIARPVWDHLLFDAPYNRDLPGVHINWTNYQDRLAEAEERRAREGRLLHGR
jgi:5'-nucleotidase